MNVLIVRLGALGDIIHALPAAAALRAAFPAARIDWLVDRKHRGILELATVVDTIVTLETPTLSGWRQAIGLMRQARYDAALDMQGLLKSAVLARASGAGRVIGFSLWHLREKTARPFYSTTDSRVRAEETEPELPPHVIFKNLHLLRTLGVHDDRIVFPLARVNSAALAQVRAELGPSQPFALLNPGAAWPNKRWPVKRFGEIAAFLHDARGLPAIVLWGPGEETLARDVVRASHGSARLSPPTGLGDLLELSRAASLVVSGDTGPLHIACAAGTPAVALFGPTDSDRNGPWKTEDISLSRYPTCRCHYQRRCHEDTWCLGTIEVTEVSAAIERRLNAGADANG